MVSGKFVHLIETHGNEIINRVIDEIRRLPEVSHVRVMLEPELREWREELVENLGHWLRTANEPDLAHRYEERGKQRFEENMPLHECVQALCLVREKMVDYIEEQITSKDTMELYAEEELERRLGRFFDLLVIHFVRGYEKALRKSMLVHGAPG
jgi:nitrate reductase NapAB chaperone NapD